MPAGIGLAAYRVVQEALTNCLKHARALTATVTVTYSPSAVEVEVVDDGTPTGSYVSPGLHASDYASGHGLAGMRERVMVYRGEFVAGTLATGGFSVRARFPLPDPAQPAGLAGVASARPVGSETDVW